MLKLTLLIVLSATAHAQFFGGSASKLRGKNIISPLTCSDGEGIVWVEANNQFECGTVSGGGGGSPTAPTRNTFSATDTSVVVTHSYGFRATGKCAIGTTTSYVPLVFNSATTTTSATTFNFDAASGDGFCEVEANGGVVYPGAGFPVSTGSAWGTSRTIAAGTGIGVTNGDGVAGNPTIAVATPGSDTYVLFNDGGAIGADAGFTYNKTTDVLTVLGGIATGDGTTAGSVLMNELAANGSNFRKIGIPDALTQDLTINLPDGNPTAGQVWAHGAPSSGISAGSWVSLAANTTATSNQFFTAYNSTTGAFTKAQPAFTDISGAATLAQLPATDKVRECIVTVGDPGAASSVLADDNDSPASCGNEFGTNWTITSVACYAHTGSPTVTPVRSDGTAILTGALTCGTAAWAAGTISGTPVISTFSGTGATCAAGTGFCSIDANITTAGGVAKYLVIKITGTI